MPIPWGLISLTPTWLLQVAPLRPTTPPVRSLPCRKTDGGMGMSGICKVDDPNAIQACIWSAEQREGKGQPKFNIIFQG